MAFWPIFFAKHIFYMYQDAAKKNWQNFRGFYPPKKVFSQPLGPKKVFHKLRCTHAYRGFPPYATLLPTLFFDNFDRIVPWSSEHSNIVSWSLSWCCGGSLVTKQKPTNKCGHGRGDGMDSWSFSLLAKDQPRELLVTMMRTPPWPSDSYRALMCETVWVNRGKWLIMRMPPGVTLSKVWDWLPFSRLVVTTLQEQQLPYR